MASSTSFISYPHEKSLKYLSWSVLIILLLFRVVLFGWLPVLFKGDFSWVDPVYQIGTYAFTAIFLFLNRDQLSLFHIDQLAIFILVLFKPLQTLILPFLGQGLSSRPMAFPNIPAIMIWIIAVWILIILWPNIKTMPKIRGTQWGWLFFGAIIGFALVIINTFLLLPWAAVQKTTPIIDITLLLAYPYQMGYAGIDEEPLFRGILWGQLRKQGWKEFFILITQAFLFMLAHGRLLTNISNIPFALSVFGGAIIFGLVVMRSRTISSSIIAHGFYNASGFLSSYLIG